MMIPSMGSMSAMYKMYNDLGLYDTYLGIIIGSFGGFGTGFVLLYGFFKNLDWSYAEAASVDGAGHYTIFFRIMFPMALPGIVADPLRDRRVERLFYRLYVRAQQNYDRSRFAGTGRSDEVSRELSAFVCGDADISHPHSHCVRHISKDYHGKYDGRRAEGLI